jgi:glycosyltransferase involved in cell wall biosynthesis
VPPGDSAAWVNALEKVIRDPVLVAELSKKGLEKAKQFSWSATAETTWEELKKIYGTPFS